MKSQRSNGAFGKTQSQRSLLGGRLSGQFDSFRATIQPYAEVGYLYEYSDAFQTSDGSRYQSAITEMSRGAGGLKISGGPGSAVFGLTPYISAQGEWDWLNGGDAALPSGQILSQDDWGLSWQAGLNGRLTGLGEVIGRDAWLASALEGANVSFSFMSADFGRENDSRSINWSIGFDLD